MDNRFTRYSKIQYAYFRPYEPGESLSDVKVCPGVVPESGGAVGCDPKNTIDQWYISPEALARCYTPDPVEEEIKPVKPAKKK